MGETIVESSPLSFSESLTGTPPSPIVIVNVPDAVSCVWWTTPPAPPPPAPFGDPYYIKKYKEKPNDERLEVIINEILNSGHTQKDDLTIVVIDSKN